MKYIKNAIYAFVFFYVCLVAYYFGMQRDFMYFPQLDYVALEEADSTATFKEMSFKTEDGLSLKAWYAPATHKALTFVYFHGNADSLSAGLRVAEPYVAEGYGFLIAEYRGYSGMPGKPSENGLYADARAAVHTLFDRGVSPSSTIMMGHSLGAAIAAQVAMEYDAPGLVMIAPFRSTVRVAEKLYPYFPVSLLVLDRYDSEEKIKRYKGSLMILHGDSDTVIPQEHGKALFEAANEPKLFNSIDGRDHGDLFDDIVPLVLPWADGLAKAITPQ